MRYGFIKDKVCINVGEFETIESVQDIKEVFIPDQCDDIVECSGEFGINDFFEEGTWIKNDIISPEEKRKEAYKTDLIITWENKMITVDEANKIFVEYFAEGNSKSDEIQILIIAAKEEIREKYPD